MNQVPTAVWNRIAQTQTLATEWASDLFRMTPSEMDQALEMQRERMTKAGYSSTVIVAYQTMAPLLAESQAIQAFVASNPELATALPDVLTAGEALQYAVSEWRMGEKDAETLLELLSRLEATTAA